MPRLLEVQDLKVVFTMRNATLNAVDGVGFTLERGQRLGLVGESGAGKSVTGFSILNLISRPGRIAAGAIRFEGQELVGLPAAAMRRIRGNRICMIFQDPMMTLNPVLSIGVQMVETLQAHSTMRRAEAREIAIEALRSVDIPSPEKRLEQYPHQLSGGMRQRIVIAIALLNKPGLIIADEPTTALDVTIQAGILELLNNLAARQGMGFILITHDLAVVSQTTDRIAVMYAGRIVETGPTAAVVAAPVHPYTQGLLGALPSSAAGAKRLVQIKGVMPSLYSMPPGCSFHPRCPRCGPICEQEAPQLRQSPGSPPSHLAAVACHMAR